MIKGDNFNSIYKLLIKDVLNNGEKRSPRGLNCFEIQGGEFILTDPSKSLLTLKERGLSYSFNAAEKLCYITGNSGEEILPKYAPNISQFINEETGRFDGSYGPRLIKQYKHVLDLLKKDPDSRRAIMTINNYHEDTHDSLDIPCTMFLQFILRDNKLNLIVYMRSNDLLWGTPYDVSQFTFIQECFAGILGVELGYYRHIVGSLHIYERDLKRFEKILDSEELVDDIYFQTPVDVKTYEQLQDQAISVLNDHTLDNSTDCNNILIAD
jgi:thymidylate synthase